SAATFALLCASALFGRFIHRRMPETYRTRETLETMQLVIGMLVTFAALVLGLLTASVKNSYDAATRDRHAYALHLTALDQCLRDYGPETRSAREDLARYTAAVIASTWPHEPPPVGIAYPDTRNMPVVGSSPVLGDIMNRIGQRIRALTPTTREKTATAEDCQDLYHGVIAARMTVIEDAGTELSVPFFSILIFWLTVVFFTLGLAAPRNRIAALGILLCALSLSSAVYVIIDLSLPYSGFMAISSGEMRNALTEMMAPGQ
ncbi:MAG TPA: hypothetical protein VHB27_02290, partial [Rhodopila sp.]|uniref:bestrophin-like domain n=1 Tax=Rhodopila sp. TaxID=2480087 RepID=UPI002C6ABC37